MARHTEDRLGGVVEAALNKAMNDEDWLLAMADDPEIVHNDPTDVFQALESFITDVLARISSEDDIDIVAYLQDADGNERTLDVTEPDPADGSYCVHMDDQGQSWIRIVPITK